MTFDKTAYQREYMRRKRASQPPSRAARMEAALTEIRGIVADRPGPASQQIREAIESALGKPA